MKIAMGCDHGGIHLKEHIKKYLIGKGIEVVDRIATTEVNGEKPKTDEVIESITIDTKGFEYPEPVKQ